VVPYWVSRSPEAMVAVIRQEGVTVLNQTPSAFRQLLSMGEQGGLAVRLVVFGGEALNYQSLGEWFGWESSRGTELVNMYGITETTVHVTERAVKAADARAGVGSLIGRPLEDLSLYVLDGEMEASAEGESGEIYVGGGGVARGYLGRADLTAERFVPDPYGEAGARLYRSGDLGRWTSEGELEYLGRGDEQIKVW